MTAIQSIVTIPERNPNSHKYDYGKLQVCAGSPGMSGAAMLATEGALRSGVGLVSVAVPEAIRDIISPTLPCAMTEALPHLSLIKDWLKKKDKEFCARVLGPGMGRDEQVQEHIIEIIKNSSIPLLLDADALVALAKDVSLLNDIEVPVILTPHEGEFARLTGFSREEISEHRLECISDWLGKFQDNIVLVLKGNKSIVARGAQERFVNTTGNPGMAKGGSGDVLSGLIGGLLASNRFDAFQSACLGVHLHGLAGDIASEINGQEAMNAGDLPDCLPAAFQAFENLSK